MARKQASQIADQQSDNLSVMGAVEDAPDSLQEDLEPGSPGSASVGDVLSDINVAIEDIAGSSDLSGATVIKKATFELSDMIPCKSLFLGKMVYTSPTNGARYIWKDFGSVTHVPFGELQTMNNHKPQYLNKPMILINEPDVVEFFNLTPVYEMVANINKLDVLFKSGNLDLIRKRLKDAVSVGMRDVVISKVRKMREENALVDINIIKALQEELRFVFE